MDANDKCNKLGLYLFITFATFVFFPNNLLGLWFNNLILIAGVLFLLIISYVYDCNGDNGVTRLVFIIPFLLILKYLYHFEEPLLRQSEFARFMFYVASYILFLKIFRLSCNLYRFVVVILSLQVFVVFFQVLDCSFMSSIYNSDKVGHATSNYKQFRYTGTLFNPNTLGVFFVFCMSLMINYTGRFKYYVVLLFLLFLSGSRTGFLIAAISLLIYEFSCNLPIKRTIFSIVVFLASFLLMGIFLETFSNDFYYFSQLSKVFREFFQGEGISAFTQVTSLMLRFENWNMLIEEFYFGGPVVWFFGLPDIPIYRYADSSYIYVFTKFGIIFGLAFFFMLFSIYKLIISHCCEYENKRRVFLWFSFSLLSGIFSDILVSYYYWIMLITFPLLVNFNEKA
ncbi:hypothetical protein [Vibrio salilacus]|uniref:hypothetical protein n=1 Tax=Vibrio salilacus TaxID=1323749 RepID=UPI0012FE55EA|nr:hypothetical protein [Vibrio salilacus]